MRREPKVLRMKVSKILWTKIQGPTRDGMNRPRGVKNMRTTTENCTQYIDAGGVKFNGLNPKEGKISIPMKTYKEISRKHMIDHCWKTKVLVDIFWRYS